MCDMGYCGIWISITLTTKTGVAPDLPQALPISRVWREMHFCHINLGKFFYIRVSQVFETGEMVQLHVSAVLMGETAEPSSFAGLVVYKFPPEFCGTLLLNKIHFCKPGRGLCFFWAPWVTAVIDFVRMFHLCLL